MNILIASQYWAPENGVPQRRWAWLSRLLVEQGHQVTVIAPPPHYDRKIGLKIWMKKLAIDGLHGEEFGSSGETIFRSPFLPAGKSLTARALNQAFVGIGMIFRVLWRTGNLRGYQPDVVVGTVPAIPISIVVWFLGKIYKVPYVIDLRDAWPDLLEQADSWNSGMGKPSFRQKILSRGPLQVVSWLTKHVMNYSLQDARAIISTSEKLADDLSSRPGFDCHQANRKIVTIRNVFPPETRIPKQYTNIDGQQGLNVLYAGTVGRAQNLKNAFDALRLARGSGVDVKFRIVGSGAEKMELRKYSADLGEAVSFEPSRSADDLNTYYDWADTALVHLADWEPLERTVPSKLYELLDLGIHISAVARGETAEIVERLDAGQVVSPDDPEALADLWMLLARNRSKLLTAETGKEWVNFQRDQVVPEILHTLFQHNEGTRCWT